MVKSYAMFLGAHHWPAELKKKTWLQLTKMNESGSKAKDTTLSINAVNENGLKRGRSSKVGMAISCSLFQLGKGEFFYKGTTESSEKLQSFASF